MDNFEGYAVGYARISSNSQIDNTSIVEQINRISAFCIAKNWSSLKIFVDEGYSASNNDRPDYQSMLNFVKCNKVNYIIVNKIDRIHRNQFNLLHFINVELAPFNISFVSVNESFDTGTHVGKMILGILSIFSEFERDTINERTKNGRLNTAINNKYSGGRLPYGYILQNRKIYVDEFESEIIKLVFDLFIKLKYNYYKISKILNNENIPTKTNKNKTKLTTNHIKNMLILKTYTGINLYNGIKENNNIMQTLVYPEIINIETFNYAQIIMLENKHTKTRK